MFSSNASQVSTAANYVEDVFSTYLYTGNGSTQTITNGIDLSTYGGLVWFKNRGAVANNLLIDSARGSNALSSNTTAAQVGGYSVTSLTNGFSFSDNDAAWNASSNTYTSWTFRKQAKFFDIQTFSGGRPDPTVPLSHSLGSVPGTIIVKRYDSTGPWYVYHRSLGATKYLVLNTTAAEATGSSLWNDTNPTSTTFVAASALNASGATYVAYLFAHDAGGFGAAGTDNVISCGSFTASSGAATVTLGYEPQWVLYKQTDGADNWKITDNMRGMFAPTTNGYLLYPNLSNAEAQAAGAPYATATGFSFDGVNNGPGSTSGTYIYIAIRRGPMKTPTSGTSVYNASTWGGGTSGYTVTGAGFPPDTVLLGWQTSLGGNSQTWFDRLRGTSPALYTAFTVAEDSTYPISSFDQNGFKYSGSNWTAAGYNRVQWMFRRAPGFFDVVCYTGTGSARTLNHNLGVTPELIINKNRSGTDDWYTTTASLTNPDTYVLTLNSSNAQGNTGVNFIYNRTASTFSVFSGLSNSGQNYVNYLFATVAGVSKVGSYTGTAALQTIDCGFTGGARFVLIKRTDSTGDWYVWDSARGISSGNDPYLLINSTAAEVTGTNYVDTTSVGFQVTAAAPAGINASGGTYIFLAIA